MKRKTLFVASLLTVVATLAISSTQALPASRVTSIKKSFAGVPSPELAAKAASIVDEAKLSERDEVAISVLRLVAAQKPSAIPSVVGSISKVSPESSPALAAEATSLSKSQVEAIVKAATSAAPKQASKIAAAVAKANPDSAVSVASTAVTMVPSAFTEITESVVGTVPQSKQGIESDATLVRLSKKSALLPFYPGHISFLINSSITGWFFYPPSHPNYNPPILIPQFRVAFGFDSARNYGQP